MVLLPRIDIPWRSITPSRVCVIGYGMCTGKTSSGSNTLGTVTSANRELCRLMFYSLGRVS